MRVSGAVALAYSIIAFGKIANTITSRVSRRIVLVVCQTGEGRRHSILSMENIQIGLFRDRLMISRMRKLVIEKVPAIVTAGLRQTPAVVHTLTWNPPSRQHSRPSNAFARFPLAAFYSHHGELPLESCSTHLLQQAQRYAYTELREQDADVR